MIGSSAETTKVIKMTDGPKVRLASPREVYNIAILGGSLSAVQISSNLKI
jgi:hypothetical protein